MKNKLTGLDRLTIT